MQVTENVVSDMSLGLSMGSLRLSQEMEACAIAAGTLVLTLCGARPIEQIAPGDRVITRSGARVVREVGVARLQAAKVLRISEGVLAKDTPEADVVIGPNQPILLRDWRAPALAGQSQALLPAFRLADGEYIREETVSEVVMVTLCFDRAEVIYAGGLELACAAVSVPA